MKGTPGLPANSTSRSNSFNVSSRGFPPRSTLRFAVSIVIYQFGFVQVLGDEDSSGWWAGAILQRRWEQQGVGLLDLPLVLVDVYTGPHRGYSYMLGILFYLTGAPARLPAAALNCFIGALTVVFTYRIARSLLGSVRHELQDTGCLREYVEHDDPALRIRSIEVLHVLACRAIYAGDAMFVEWITDIDNEVPVPQDERREAASKWWMECHDMDFHCGFTGDPIAITWDEPRVHGVSGVCNCGQGFTHSGRAL